MAQKKKTKSAKAKPAKAPAKKATKAKDIKYVYDFEKTDGDAKQRELLGGKANLAEMARIGLPVPPGFTISTEVCTYFYDNKKSYPKSLDGQIRQSVELMEKQLDKKLGDLKPLLLSVRSGARIHAWNDGQ